MFAAQQNRETLRGIPAMVRANVKDPSPKRVNWATVAEIIASIAVVLSLIYLSLSSGTAS